MFSIHFKISYVTIVKTLLTMITVGFSLYPSHFNALINSLGSVSHIVSVQMLKQISSGRSRCSFDLCEKEEVTVDSTISS